LEEENEEQLTGEQHHEWLGGVCVVGVVGVEQNIHGF
jgi:hypothetical protein